MSKFESERIQKVLANAGYGSRRQLEELIKQGRIKVNSKIANLGDKISSTDRVILNGKRIKIDGPSSTELKIIAYNKPAGEICTRKDKVGRKTVFERLPDLKGERWVNIGRLDINTSGLILFTTNGNLANKLMHPSSDIEREYAVRVLGTATETQLHALQTGIKIDDAIAAFNKIVDMGGEGTNHWYDVIIKEGRNREVRRLWESQGLKVSRLIRVRFGPYKLPRNKKTGVWWELSSRECARLIEVAGMEPAHQSVHRQQKRRRS